MTKIDCRIKSDLCHEWRCIDLDTGEDLSDNCQWADDETGEYGLYKLDEDGKMFVADGEAAVETKKGNIKLERREGK